MDILEQICRKNLTHYSGSMAARATEGGDVHCSRWFGARVRDYIKADTGWAVDTNSSTYRRARAKLERMAREGRVVAYRPGPWAYVFYWPAGLAEKLRAE